MLIIFAGLPGSGKTTLARALARELCAVHVRIDSIEQAIRGSGVVPGSLNDAGYSVGHAVAEDNLGLGRTVIADSVNPWMLTRNAWRDVGVRAGVRVIEIEVVCSDPAEHRRRMETRVADIEGLALPDWETVMQRDHQPWDRNHVVIETAGASVQACLAQLRAVLRA